MQGWTTHLCLQGHRSADHAMDPREGSLSECPDGWLAPGSPELGPLSIGFYSLSFASKFETVNYMVILVTADRISHIDLNMGPIFLSF